MIWMYILGWSFIFDSPVVLRGRGTDITGREQIADTSLVESQKSLRYV